MFCLVLLLRFHLVWGIIVPGYSSAKEIKSSINYLPASVYHSLGFRQSAFCASSFFYAEYISSADEDSVQLQKARRKAIAANKFGIAALVSVFIPVVNLIALPLAIVAIAKGISAKKSLLKTDPERKVATKAIAAGVVTIVLVGVVLLIVLGLYNVLYR